MKSDEIREKYLKFFEKRGHVRIKPSPLVLEDDPTTLFTSAGMQQLVPYLLGKHHPLGKRLVNSQPTLRTQDINEVGDSNHTTFFEMLGNWSLGDYFKEEQLPWIWEFFTKELGLPKDRLWVSVFGGTKSVPKDTESYELWKKLGVPEEKIHFYGVKENWWSRSGTPDQMPVGEIGGPDSEVFFEFTNVKHDPKYGQKCHPNCQCGRFLEIGNSVFMQYQKTEVGLKELPLKSVDFGGGLERITAAVNDNPDIFETGFFASAKKLLSGIDTVISEDSGKGIRVVLDHIRAAIFIIDAGVEPANKEHGYVLRRLIRRAGLYAKLANIGLSEGVMTPLVNELTKKYLDIYPSIREKKATLVGIINAELGKFEKTLVRGMKEIFSKRTDETVTGTELFDFYQTYGFPKELVLELAKDKGIKVDLKGFDEAVKKHQEKSRTASTGTFKGGLVDDHPDTIKLHTATHLLHWALRKTLGESVRQEGSNITRERLRFDFSFERKLTEDELKKVEDLINEKISEDLPVRKTVEDKDAALKSGALAFFKETYPDEVSVYTIGKDLKEGWVSKELCGGPHVSSTGEIKRVKMKKQEKIGSNLIRVYLTLD